MGNHIPTHDRARPPGAVIAIGRAGSTRQYATQSLFLREDGAARFALTYSEQSPHTTENT